MTTLTLRNPTKLPRYDFRDLDELTEVLLTLKFETELEKSVEEGKKIPTDSYLNLQ